MRATPLCTGLLLLLVLLAQSANSQEIRYLSLDGDGTATVVVDQKAGFALIADGGRQGKAGIAGARIGNLDVLDFLKQQGVERLAISCSHPHKDHMGGLITMVSDVRIKQFDVVFVATGHEKSLAVPYERTTGREAKFYSASRADGMSEASRSATSLTIRNFVYDPAAVGPDEHDAAMIVEYDIGPGDSAMRLVDFDDASEKLVAVWANRPGSRVNTVVVPHHGSRNNQITVLLNDLQRYGLKNAIITVNRGNRYRHPAPETLLALIEKLGPDHVYVTGADPRGVAIGEDGLIDPRIAENSRESLGAFIDAQIAQRQAEAKTVISQDSALKFRRNTAEFGADDLAAFITTASTDTVLKESDRRRLVRILTDIENLQVARRRVRGAERKNALAFILSGKEWGDGPTSRPSSPEPPPEPPARPGHGAFPEKLNEARAVHAEAVGNAQLDDAGQNQSGTGGGNPGGSGSGGGSARSGGGGGGSTLFRSMLLTPMPVWGGVILGNQVDGPSVRGLDFVAESSEEDMPPSSYSLVFTLGEGTLAEYPGVTPLELWAAYNFVQPTEALRARLDFELPSNAAGIIGMTNIEDGTWEFAIHPAIADSPLAVDAMRLDMFLSVGQRFALFRPKELPAYLSATHLADLEIDTYQWYDDHAVISDSNGVLRVSASSIPNDCLLRVRLVKENHPGWLDQDDRLGSVVSRVAELEPRADPGRIETLIRGGSPVLLSDDPLIFAAIEKVKQELKPIQNLSLNPHITGACGAFPSLVAIDRLAKVIALLNWYSGYGSHPLPALPSSLTFPEHMSIAPELEEKAVFGRVPPLGPMWLIVTTYAVVAVIIAMIVWGLYRSFAWTWRRLRS